MKQSRRKQAPNKAKQTDDRTVVVQGVIYIFNPPNPAKLQIDDAAAEDATQTAGL